MKICSTCKLSKSLGAFYGKSSRCKACTAKHSNCRTSVHYQSEPTDLTEEQKQALSIREQKRIEVQARLTALGLL